MLDYKDDFENLNDWFDRKITEANERLASGEIGFETWKEECEKIEELYAKEIKDLVAMSNFS